MSKVIEEVTLFAQVRHVVDLQCRIYDVCETVEGKPWIFQNVHGSFHTQIQNLHRNRETGIEYVSFVHHWNETSKIWILLYI